MNRKINPFAQIYEAFRGFTYTNAFYNLRRQSTGSKIAYSFIVSILTTVLLCGLYAIQITTNKELNQFLNSLPEFSYSNGEFYCENRYETAQDGTYLLVDTTQDKFGESQVKSALSNSDITQIMLISRTNIVTYKTLTEEYQEMKLSDMMNVFNIQTISRLQILSRYKSFVFKAAMYISLFVFPFQYAKLFFIALLLALIAMIINAACGSNKDFPTLYWISFYMQSVFMIIIAIGDPFWNFKFFTTTIACLLFFIIMMYQTLKHGEPITKSATVTSYNDDFDTFTQKTDTIPSAFSPNNLNTNTDSSFNSADSASYYTADTDIDSSHNSITNTEEKNKSTSGFSLKSDE